MEKYIGAKIILAEPMSEAVFNGRYRHVGGEDTVARGFSKVSLEAEVAASRPGYHVQYDDKYHSWSPKDVFERAYRKISDGEFRLLVEG